MSGLEDNYSFLNDYLSRAIQNSAKADDRVLEDDNSFYDTNSDDEQEPDSDIQYGFDEATEDDADQGAMLADQFLAQDESDATGMPYEEVMAGYEPASYTPRMSEEAGFDETAPRVKKKIADIESGGKYSAFNPKGGGGGAVGKYQFRWNIWKDSIQKVTGVKDKEAFLKSPAAQEKYYSWYERHYLYPQVSRLEQYNQAGLSKEQLAKLVHFRGAAGAKRYLQGTLSDKPESYNIPISKYIGTRQMGGAIALTPASQHFGLNNPNFDHMHFPLQGTNTFRGLDDGTPVLLEDETGKKKVLKGRHHTAKMTGRVNETRL